MRLIEGHARGINPAAHGEAVGARLHSDRSEHRSRGPHQALEVDALHEHVARVSHRDGRSHCVDIDHEPTLADPTCVQPAPLTDRDQFDGVDSSDRLTRGVDHPTRMQSDTRAEKRSPSAALGRDEAHVLAVGLVGRSQPQPSRPLPHDRLRHFSDGEHTAGQRGLIEHVHDVALIFRGVDGTGERPSTPDAHPPDVVAGREGVETELTGSS